MSHTYDAQIWTLIAASLIFIAIFVGYALQFRPDLEVASHRCAIHTRF